MKRTPLFLHFLVMAATLVGLPRLDEGGHRPEDFIGFPLLVIDEVQGM
jgi:hypothetical protein